MTTKEQQIDTCPDCERAWGFQELAVLYFPHIKPDSASRQLSRWICFSTELVARLKENGWKPGRKVLTPKQASCLFLHLGPPGS